jgi:hypothetical protein
LGFLKAVSAHSDGTVVAVGYTKLYVPFIYQNAASAPEAPTPAAPVTTTATLTAVPTTMMLATPLDAAAVDQLLAATGPADKPLSFRLVRRAVSRLVGQQGDDIPPHSP